MEPHGVRNPPGRHAEVIAGKAIRSLHHASFGSQQVVVGVRQSYEYAGQRIGHRVPGEPGMLHGFPSGFKEQPVLGIHLGRFLFGDPEKVRIEVTDVVQECTPFRHRPPRHSWLGVVVLVSVPAVEGNLGN